ncbi:uncharacterized protein K460DRAFT_216526 [Cucurbitaria berberidis CBS 394.84]|uniref:Uncharacterized protein n=1 Tax=Cucurbitaria berberidis CBS 394.84 TaxID=1168544 RepID=A0A9P4G7B0_9PLEO|nr:uncharacterized protein K460DRAFT_216526 [Cucurbitaria berberidis CBS 394.84]KAF1840054.1 hypothetical protein K460DRAFT_216526 [Cucurbitaria berberidis CBS 394.84]
MPSSELEYGNFTYRPSLLFCRAIDDSSFFGVTLRQLQRSLPAQVRPPRFTVGGTAFPRQLSSFALKHRTRCFCGAIPLSILHLALALYRL